MKTLLFEVRRLAGVCALVAAFVLARATFAADAPARVTLSFDKDWRFFKGDQALGASHKLDDSAWHKLDLPHDWSIEGPFDQNAPTAGDGAYLPSGVAWYRKTFAYPPQAQGKRVFIEFDGIMANSEVYINDSLVGSRPSGVSGLRYDLTDNLSATGPNLLAVRTDTTRQPASRWYEGAGIYRHTRLVIEDPVHVEHWATVVTTTGIGSNSATVHVTTAAINQSKAASDVTFDIIVTGPAGAIFTPPPASRPAQNVAPGQIASFAADVVVFNPQLWQLSDPFLYTATVRVQAGGKVVDEESTKFGIRTAEFKADSGFWLNGKNIKLYGVCLHQDAGALGIAVPASAWETRLTQLKKYGANAVRTAHNPPSPEFLDACDRLGLLVMDEAFDAWSVGKEPADYHLYFKDGWQRDEAAMIQRDRNHPSIIIYSLGNEIWDILPQKPDPAPDQFTGPMRSIDVARDEFIPMRDLAHQLDPTRPVTLAVVRPNVNNTYANGFADLMDVVGQNYRDNELAAAHRQNPNRKIIGTESYKTDATWLALRDNPALAGIFVWAGVDYLGEAGAWPNVVSASGNLDRTNFPKSDALQLDSWWSTRPVVHIVRAQAASGRGGRGASAVANWTPATSAAHSETVSVYSNCEQVELFLNDQSLGSKPRDRNDNPRVWQVAYAAGTLRAVGSNGGQSVARDELHSAGVAAMVLLSAERPKLPNDWDDVLYVRASIADANGNTVPSADNLIRFKITGPGVIAAVDNGLTTDHDPFQAVQRHAYQGTCVAILRSTADTGDITLTASSDGLTGSDITVQAAPATTR
jgi:beta-galactosidase